ncbi:hypothetical protein OQH60_04645 [Campylobacter sp. MIT 21-1685]|nr:MULTISPECIES: hypothetical protein [unclassified Campylobacter]MCX2683107.1 hypothetical protein [Campylobacter sp. MIT 21-1684]MCX2751433.1 hypothetical protein [Campylobacter sp. MIT 21-1682]MCX2807633.1 hypothetical protein [Campylobacter sp. MIT 21-1685]
MKRKKLILLANAFSLTIIDIITLSGCKSNTKDTQAKYLDC